MVETELKYIVTKKEAQLIRRKLIGDFQHHTKNYEKVIMYDFSASKLLYKDDARLRLKTTRNPKECELSYKKRLDVASDIKQEEEYTVLVVGPKNELVTILAKLGLAPQSGYERIREKFTDNHKNIVTIDQFCFGYIVEIEGSKSFISRINQKIGASKYQVYRLSCDDYYAKWCQSLKIDQLEFIPLKQDISVTKEKS